MVLPVLDDIDKAVKFWATLHLLILLLSDTCRIFQWGGFQ